MQIKKNMLMKILSVLVVPVLSVAIFVSCSVEKEPVPQSSKWMIVPDSYSIGEGDELIIAPEFSSSDVAELDFEWQTSDPDVVSVVEDRNSSIVVRGEASGTAVISVGCPGETRRLSADIIIKVSHAPLRILAIGNSFSQDAVEQYLWDLLDAAGIDAVIGNMYIGGCSLEKHWNNVQENSASYEYRKVEDGKKTNAKDFSIEMALNDENWDYVSLQQASDYSGIYDEYQPYLEKLAGYVRGKATNRNVKLVFHQTWAYSSDSGHNAFLYYDRDQMKMYEGIVDASRHVMAGNYIDFIIPSGTAIQNGRTSYLGDTFDRDGYHLDTDYGRFTAACTWYESLTGENVMHNEWKPISVTDRQADVVRAAAHYAVLSPYSVTDMSEDFTSEACEGPADSAK